MARALRLGRRGRQFKSAHPDQLIFMPKKTKKHHPPKYLQGVLWSADVKGLDLEENKTYIIHQILSLGTLEELKWLFRTYPITVLKKIFVNKPIKSYTPAAFHFSKEVLLSLKNKNLEEANYVKTFPRNIRR